MQAAKIELFSNGGWSLDLSRAVTDRAVFHLDNAYYIPNVEFSGVVAKTNLASNTAFRGFGGPQGMLVIEEIIDRVARRPASRRKSLGKRIFIAAPAKRTRRHYGQEIEDNRIERIWSRIDARRANSNRAARNCANGMRNIRIANAASRLRR